MNYRDIIKGLSKGIAKDIVKGIELNRSNQRNILEKQIGQIESDTELTRH